MTERAYCDDKGFSPASHLGFPREGASWEAEYGKAEESPLPRLGLLT